MSPLIQCLEPLSLRSNGSVAHDRSVILEVGEFSVDIRPADVVDASATSHMAAAATSVAGPRFRSSLVPRPCPALQVSVDLDRTACTRKICGSGCSGASGPVSRWSKGVSTPGRGREIRVAFAEL